MRRYTDGEHGFGDIMPSATVHIRPLRDGDVAEKIQNYDYLTGEDAVSSRMVGVTGTTTSDAVSAMYITVAASSTVCIHALVSAFCTAGAAASSGGAYIIEAMASSAGQSVTVTTRPQTAAAMSDKTWTASVAAGVGKVALTVTGSAGNNIQWCYDITYLVLPI